MTLAEEETSFCFDIPGFHLKTPVYATLIISLTLCVVGNSTICLIVARHYQLHTVTNANIVNMAVGHLLFSIFCVPSYLSILSQRQVSLWLCSCLGFSFTFFATESTLALMLIAFERYYVIISRRSSSRQWSARTAKKLILATWLVALMLSIPWVALSDQHLSCTKTLFKFNHSMTVYRLNQCLPFLNPPSSKVLQFFNIFLVVLCFILPLATVATLYCRMIGPLWQGYNQVRPLGAGHPKTIRYTAEIRTARTMLLMFFLFLCCWVTYCYIAISNALNWPYKHITNETLTIASISLVFISFSLDPIIYALRNPRISMILRGRNRKRRRVKFGVSEFATDGQRTMSEQTSKSIHGRCESTFETTTSKSEDFRAPSTAQTVSSSRQSGSVLSFSYHVGVEEEPKIIEKGV